MAVHARPQRHRALRGRARGAAAGPCCAGRRRPARAGGRRSPGAGRRTAAGSGAAGPAPRRDTRARGRPRRASASREVVVGVLDQRGQQRVAVLEVAVERGAGDAELARDRVERHGGRPAGLELVERDALYGCPYLCRRARSLESLTSVRGYNTEAMEHAERSNCRGSASRRRCRCGRASCRRPGRGRSSCGWRRRASRSPSSRCGAASTTTSRSSRSCPGTTSWAWRGTGARVAALTKVGGWADRVVLDDADLVPVPDGVSAEAVETRDRQRRHGVADAAPRGEGPARADDRRARRGGRRRHGARAARAPRGHPT